MTRPRHLPPPRGFTLVELLIAMSLSILVGGVLYLLQSTGLSTVNKGTTTLTLQSEARRNMELLVQDLRCTRDVVAVSPTSLRVLRYMPTPDGEISGGEAIQTVEYRIEKVGENQSVLTRQVEKQEAKVLIKTNSIETDLFIPYWEDEKGVYTPFDMKSNDSGQRKRISYMILQLSLRQGKEKFVLRTSATLRPLHTHLLQPFWKFR